MTINILTRSIYLIICLLLYAGLANAVSLERIVSREDPKFDCTQAAMTVGFDGNVYLANNGYLLRLSRDGKQKFGGDVVQNGLRNATANADGIIATANAHFQHSLNFYSSSINRLTGYDDFVFKDFYDVPDHVEAGVSGDFYSIDEHRQRIVRISPAGKLVKVYPFKSNLAKSRDFRVCEATQTFLMLGLDRLWRSLSFDGDIRWEKKLNGAIDIDSAGNFYVLQKTTLQCFIRNIQQPANENEKDNDNEQDPNDPSDPFKQDVKVAKPQEQFTVSWRELLGEQLSDVNRISIFGGELIVKRSISNELFQVYDLATGKQKCVVYSEHERVAADFPNMVWTAGESMPFSISMSQQTGGNNSIRPTLPMHVWVTAFGDDDWRELKQAGNKLEVPTDLAGLYQLRIAPTLNPQADSEYMLRTVIEVHVPESKGTVNVWTPQNRVWWGRGEEIPVTVSVRTTNQIPDQVTLTLQMKTEDGLSKSLHEETLRIVKGDKPGDLIVTTQLPATFTSQLASGRYELRATAANFTSVAQPIRIGPGSAATSPFRVTLHGDYRNLNSVADVWTFADTANEMLTRFQKLGVNQTVNRTFSNRYPLYFTSPTDGNGLLRDIERRLVTDPNGVATQKVDFGFADAHALGAFGAYGLREWLLLLGMDAALPIGTSTSYAKGITYETYTADIARYTQALKSFPAFAGWDWVANWWVIDQSLRFASPEQKPTFDAALKKANDTGVWNPLLDEVGDRTINWQPDAQQNFHDALTKVAPNLATASSGPYRRAEVYPPLSFANVDEVDLHYQSEQITTPNWTAHAPDFYKRPGKPAWLHPEFYNDIGTGEMILPMSWMGIMRGADGIGTAGNIPTLGEQPTDSRSGYYGTLSVFRALNEFTRQYGPWLTTLKNNDRVAIIVSHRQIKMDTGGWSIARYFWRLWEAYQSCLYARQPATFLYCEDIKPDTLKQFKALLIVSQFYEPEPEMVNLLAQAKKDGIAIFADGTCRESLVKEYTPLGVTFDHVEKLNGFNNDCAFWDYPEALLVNAPLITKKLAEVTPPVATVDQSEVLVSERSIGDLRFVWVVNNTHSPLSPGSLWRLNNAVGTRIPVVAQVTLPVKAGDIVYDIFSGKELKSDDLQVSIKADLRYTYARLYAVLPQKISNIKMNIPNKLIPGQKFDWSVAIQGIRDQLPLHLEFRDGVGNLLEERYTTTGTGSLTVPVNAVLPVTLHATELVSGQKVSSNKAGGNDNKIQQSNTPDNLFGPNFRDITIASDNRIALINAFDRGQNLYSLDLANGKISWSGNVGDYFAYAPVAIPNGFAVQGYDLGTAEGYHLYQIDSAGRPERRFTLPGIPARMVGWAFPYMADRINNFAVDTDGKWVAGAGNMAIAVWSPDGKFFGPMIGQQQAVIFRKLLQ